MGPFARVTGLVATIALVPVLALAQQAAPTDSAGPTATPPADGSAPPANASPEAKPVRPATGYSYGTAATPPADRAHARTARGNPAATDAIMAGFETLADGSTRLFVDLSKPAPYDTKVDSKADAKDDAKAVRSTLTYVLRGARVDRRNNENPLVTVHFNTPVNSARLVPHGRDLWLVVDLRVNVQPTATMDAAKDGTARFRIDFPKGNYLPASQPPWTAPAPSPSSPETRPPAVASTGKVSR
jgi:hypothetical protein